LVTATSKIEPMDKFVDSFSRGLKKSKIPPAKAKKSSVLQGTQHQMFLDLGQKLFGKSKECSNCGMFYVIGDVDDERQHNQICAQVIYDDIHVSTNAFLSR
jgi:zinc-finger of acetyl-transferase ESCO